MDAIISLLSKAPSFIAVPIVDAVAKMSNQKHKCESCQTEVQVPVYQLAASPTRVLSTTGRKNIAAIAPWVFENHPRTSLQLTDSVTAPENRTETQQQRQQQQMMLTERVQDAVFAVAADVQLPSVVAAAAAAPSPSVSSSSSSSSTSSPDVALGSFDFFNRRPHQRWHHPFTTTTTTSSIFFAASPFESGTSSLALFTSHHQVIAALFLKNAELSSSSFSFSPVSSSAAASSLALARRSEEKSRLLQQQKSYPKFEEINFHADCFRCECGGRLGIHCYAGDATNGSKEVLARRLLHILVSMPGYVPNATSATISKMTMEDIFFVD